MTHLISLALAGTYVNLPSFLFVNKFLAKWSTGLLLYHAKQ